MAEPTDDEDAAGVLVLQRSLATAAFMADGRLLRRSPGAFAAAQGLGPADQAAYVRFRRRLLFYRRSIREGLLDPVAGMFPVTWALLGRTGAGQACRRDFLATRPVRSPFHRDIAAAFLGWLAATGWGQERWPFLLQLAHSEILQNLVSHHPGGERLPDLRPVPSAGDRLVLDPTAQLVAYGYAVHLATPAEPVPRPEPVWLLVYRDGQGLARWAELTEATSALLVQAQLRPIGPVACGLGLHDPADVLRVLTDLQELGAILGFASA